MRILHSLTCGLMCYDGACIFREDGIQWNQRSVVTVFCPKCDRVYRKTKVCPECGEVLHRANGKPKHPPIREVKDRSMGLSKRDCCPNCQSTNIYSRRLVVYNSVIHGDLHLPILLVYGIMLLYFILRGKSREYFCRDCGHRWSA